MQSMRKAFFWYKILVEIQSEAYYDVNQSSDQLFITFTLDYLRKEWQQDPGGPLLPPPYLSPTAGSILREAPVQVPQAVLLEFLPLYEGS